MSDGLLKEDSERQVQDCYAVYRDKPQRQSMTWKLSAGDLVHSSDVYDHGVAVWSLDLQHGLDHLHSGEVGLVVSKPDKNGYTHVMTPRGTVGIVHRNHLVRS